MSKGNRVETVEIGKSQSGDVPGHPQGKNALRAVVIKANEEAVSRALADDPFGGLYEKTDSSGALLIPPSYPLLELSSMPEYSTALIPTVGALTANIEQTGFKLVSRFDEGTVPNDLKFQVRKEYACAINFFNSCVIECDDDNPTFTALRVRTRTDLENTGNAYWEVVREPRPEGVLGRIIGFRHLASHTVRLSYQGDAISVKRKVVELVATDAGDGTGDPEFIPIDPLATMDTNQKIEIPFRYKFSEKFVKTRFRRFCQIRNGKQVWFKQFGDPRYMDYRNGKYSGNGWTVGVKNRATEVIHFKLYSSRSPYGIPRYVGNLIGITGERTAEEICYRSLDSNQIPAMALLVSGGQITEDSIERMKQFVEDQVAGRRNFSTIMVLEMEPDSSDDTGELSKSKMELKPLSQYQHTDGLWKDYRDGQRANIRQSFRIPELYWGKTEEVGKAAAEARRLTDEQVFAPERALFDERMDNEILPFIGDEEVDGVLHWKFSSNSPQITDTDALVRVLTASEKTGGLTPRISRAILESITNRNFGPVIGVPRDKPFSLTLGETLASRGTPQNSLNLPGEQGDRRDGLLGHSDMTGEVAQSAGSPPASPANPVDVGIAQAIADRVKELLGVGEIEAISEIRDSLNSEASSRGWE